MTILETFLPKKAQSELSIIDFIEAVSNKYISIESL